MGKPQALREITEFDHVLKDNRNDPPEEQVVFRLSGLSGRDRAQVRQLLLQIGDGERTDFAKAYANLGNAYKGNKQYQEAEGAYKKAQGLAPDEHAVLFNLGVLHLDNRLRGVDRLARFDIAKNYLALYLKKQKGLDPKERKRVETYITETARQKKREGKRIKSEERRKARALKRKKKKAEEEKEGPGGAKK